MARTLRARTISSPSSQNLILDAHSYIESMDLLSWIGCLVLGHLTFLLSYTIDNIDFIIMQITLVYIELLYRISVYITPRRWHLSVDIHGPLLPLISHLLPLYKSDQYYPYRLFPRWESTVAFATQVHNQLSTFKLYLGTRSTSLHQNVNWHSDIQNVF